MKLIWGNGKIIWHMDMASTSGLMAKDTKDSGAKGLDMDLAKTFFKTVMYISESISTEQPKVLVRINGQTATSILATLKMGRSKAKGLGRNLSKRRQTIILVSTRMT